MAEGHRNRVKTRFLKEGLSAFPPHNVLEFILFYSIPRKDTNTIAHNLENTFGSFHKVLDASYEELLAVDGMTPNAASLIKLLPEVFRYYQTDKMKTSTPFSSNDDIGKFLVGKYVGAVCETVYLTLLDNKGSLIECIKVHEGSISSAAVDIRKMAQLALTKNASSVVLSHNHPYGIPVPSSDDINFTYNFKNALSFLGIPLLEHFIIADNQYYGMESKLKGTYEFT